MQKTFLTGFSLFMCSLCATDMEQEKPKLPDETIPAEDVTTAPPETPHIKTPQQIQAELDQAQKDFEIAKSMFIPFYTGPLITGGADNVPEGKTNVQPYLFLDTTYAKFNDDRKSIGIPNLFSIKPQLLVGHGLTTWLDITVSIFGLFNWQSGSYAQGFGDTSVTLGFQVIKETPYIPSVRITVGESFPSGRFEKLSSTKGGIDASGSGAYITTVGLNVSKVFWQIPVHPVRWRFSGTYSIPNHEVEVRSFNAFGGGFNAIGDVCVGQTLNLGTAVEVSLTQKWVFAFDVAYTYSRETTFTGFPGVDATGALASVGGPSSDQLSFAPAIEYNPNSHSGFIGGVWFSVTGRNSANFATVVLSYTYLF